jgi:hypothetical protein
LAEWLIERGIGEMRAALVEGGAIVEARIQLDGVTPAGRTVEARLQSIGTNGRNAVAVMADGSEILLPQRPVGVSEGAPLRVVITRARIPGPEPWKRPLGRAMADKESEFGGVSLGEPLPFPPAGRDEMESVGWSDILDEARTGIIHFAGGELRLFATPAMTLIDVDGKLPPAELMELGAAAAGAAIRRLDIGGSIGIDLPTVAGKAPRQTAAAAIDAAFGEHRFERTAINGFGFVQIVRPRRNASLLELAQDQAPFEARALLRRAALSGSGPRRLVAHPRVIAVLDQNAAWLDALARQVGGSVSLRPDPSLPISAGHAEPA